MSAIKSIKAPINGEMKKFELFFKNSMKTKIPLLDIITNYIIRRKGKQMRPMFVFLSAKLVGEVNESTYTAAGLIELLHTATLVHDDVVDEAYERRGFFSINALWKNKIAVLIGDFLLSKGLLLAVDKEEFQLLKIVSTAVKEMAEGELLQIEKARKLNITEDIYFEIIRQKTATLLASCTAAGAKSTGVSDEIVEKMKLFGEHAGIAFQIKDDLFDYEKTNLVGKPTGNDIQEKKMTLPLIYVLEKVSKSDRKRIIQIIRKHNKNPKKVEEVMQFVRENGGLEYATTRMNEYKDKALSLLDEFDDNEARVSLKKMIIYITERKK